MTYSLQDINIKTFEGNLVFLYGDESAERNLPLGKREVELVKRRRAAQGTDAKNFVLSFDRLPYRLYFVSFNSERPAAEVQETLRRQAVEVLRMMERDEVKCVAVTGEGTLPEELAAFVEGLTLADYSFDRFRSKEQFHLEHIDICSAFLSEEELAAQQRLWGRIFWCREWVNLPVADLNAAEFADELQAVAADLEKVKCTVMDKRKIESLRMGGLLAVNKFAAADNHLPVHLIALLPLTDNRPGFNAYAADDILTMYDGTTVEVVNTDAEGRLILADAIAYAVKNYKPRVIIDAATLTGAAVRAISTFGIAAMQQNADRELDMLKLVGNEVYERLVEFPMWKEYDELIKSDFADLRNCGSSPQAGTITAGKFLAHFAKDVPYVHLDIAGVAYFTKAQHYYRPGASGYGIRMLYAYLQMM